MSEEWRPIPGYEGRYEVSDLGRVRTVDHWSRNGSGPFLKRGRLLTPSRGRRGYLMVDFRKVRAVTDDLRRNRTLHSLVLEAFIGPRPEGLEVLHGNGDPTDNRLENLRYGTRSENGQDSVRHGTNQWANKTHCPQGHEYAQGNTYRFTRRSDGTKFRQCRTCALERARIQHADRRVGGRLPA